ncbi:MAG: GNAT family N-acetyltransferase, partial [Treponema sp.]|nr:GNAT family N-acetyltransferase [Treponema sp.]
MQRPGKIQFTGIGSFNKKSHLPKAAKRQLSYKTDYFFWGQGVGSALLKFAIDEFNVSKLWVLEKNTDAIAFYKAHGFIESGKKQFAEG